MNYLSQSNRYRPLRGLALRFGLSTWGFAALHPKLYAVARSRGLVLLFTEGGFSTPNRDFLCKAL